MWFLFLLLPGVGLCTANLVFCYIFFPISLIAALLIVIFGFFGPMYNHRIPHDSGLPNPGGFGALLYGLLSTFVCYFAAIVPHIHYIVVAITCICVPLVEGNVMLLVSLFS